MTSPNQPEPNPTNDKYDDVHSLGSRFGQDLTEQSVRTMLGGRVSSPFTGAANVFNQFVSGIASALSGLRDDLQWVKDGQEDLADRTDLLSPLLDYGSAYINPNNRVHGTGYAVFSEQLGPMRGCELIGGAQGGIRLLDKGLWDIRVHLTADGVVQISSNGPFRYELRVFSPAGDLFSRQVFHGNDIDPLTGTIVSSVVVPETGYRVRVYVTKMAGNRGILGGPAWSRLAVQHIAREVDGAWSKGSEASSPDPS